MFESDVKNIRLFLAKGRMSPALRSACNEILSAIRDKNISLVADLSAVKGYISGMKFKDNHFREDDEYNEKVLGDTLYRFLNGLHFRVSMKLGQLPSNMMVFSSLQGGGLGVAQRPQSKLSSPTLNIMKREHDAMVKKYAK